MKLDDEYEWTIDFFKKYEPGLIKNSPKMELFFCILNESIKLGDRILLFSQSLLTLNLIETFLQSNIMPDSNTFWKKHISYFRLDGSTSSQEREKLVIEFNSNKNIKLFLISTKAGSLGINLVGANRVIIFDASWNPCHDTQAIYRIYRYGQNKPCYIYRMVMDKCLEKKIYDRQIKKQGMSDRVVDECNPDAHLSLKDVTNLCHDYENDSNTQNDEILFSQPIDSYIDTVIQKIIVHHKNSLSKEPFFHESLLIDRKEKKLSQAEKRQAHRGYEMEKKAAAKPMSTCAGNKILYRIVRNDGTVLTRPVASIRPMQTIKNQVKTTLRSTRWIPAEVWQRQGMTAQEMTLPLDVVIPTNSSDKSNIILKAGQRVMVLKSTKGIYMQLDSGKIIAIRTSSKINDSKKYDKEEIIDITSESDPIPEVMNEKPTSAMCKIKSNTGLKNEIHSANFIKKTHEQSSIGNKTNLKDKSKEQDKTKQHDTVQQNKILDKDESANIHYSSNLTKLNSSFCSKFKENTSEFSFVDQCKSMQKSYNDNEKKYSSISSNSHKINSQIQKHTNQELIVSNSKVFASNLAIVDQQNKKLESSNPENSNCSGKMPKSMPILKSELKHISNIDGTKETLNYQNTSNMDHLMNLEKKCDISTQPTEYPSNQSQLSEYVSPNSSVSGPMSQYSIYQQQSQQQQSQSKLNICSYFPTHYNIQNSQLNTSELSQHSTNPQHKEFGSMNFDNIHSNNIQCSRRELHNYPQYYNSMYENNNILSSCEHPAQFVNHVSYGSYNHSHYNNHSHFHTNSYIGVTPSQMGSHTYGHWSPIVNHTSLNEQCNMLNTSNFSENITHPHQWQHQ